jgi:hypothetical protein
MLEVQQQHKAAVGVRRETPNHGFLGTGVEPNFLGFLRLATFISQTETMGLL